MLLALASFASAQSSWQVPMLRPPLQRVAGPYPIETVEFFRADSARIVVEDSSRTAKAVMDGQWMFGPPVTAEEAGGCPPQKALGRRIARELWRQHGKRVGLQEVIVRVHGRAGADRLSYVDMHYGRAELDEPWVGDRLLSPSRHR
ncbi:MAG TPA: hypothetical protein VHB25_17485 [Gemmatimonadaceae bacterium]|nr:hypothetical protein [Gemmatimonadaceae bacterium]